MYQTSIFTTTLFFWLLLLLGCGHPKPAEIVVAEKALPAKVDFNLHIKPLLSDRCFACHGPDQAKQQAGLRLDIQENAYEKTCESGRRPIVPGDLSASEVYHRILATDPKVLMPTPESHLTLTVEEKALICRWIEQGAEYKPHWSFTPPRKQALPVVKNQSWVKNDIDRFVLKKLEENGLKPSPEAGNATLLRRVSLDLTGLPPTVAEVDAFLADQTPNAYETVVRRLLASPHYGEHMAVGWLDAARYADTHGYQLDVNRTAWPYRDWVISAFNRNLSFGPFVTWQLAGDLLPNAARPNASREQLIATCFNRLHPQNQEGGIDEQEYLTEYAADRVNTFGKTFLGLTVECARCHDHKYDPISQKDYYSLFAFFNTINEAGQVPYHGESSPTLILTSREVEAKLNFLRTNTRPQQAMLDPKHPVYDAEFSAWLTEARKNPALISNRRAWLGSYSFDDDSLKTFRNDADAKRPATVSGDTDKPPKVVAGRFGRGRAVNGEGHIDLGKDLGFFEQNQPFSVSLWVNFRKKGLRGPVFARSNGLDNGNRGYECMLLPDGTLSFNLNHAHPDNSIDLRTVQKLPVGQWVHLGTTYDGSGTAAGTRIYLNGQLAPTRIFADNLKKSMLYGPGHTNGFGLFLNFMIGGKFRDSMANFWVDELNVAARQWSSLEIRSLYANQNLAIALLQKPDAKLTPVERQQLRAFFVTTSSPTFQRIEAAIAGNRAQAVALYDTQPEVMVMKERSFQRPTHVLKRGVYDAPGELVRPGVIQAISPLPADVPRNRLGLAQWLLREENPLFSRVIVNRFWQQFFGNGLVKSSDDFGNQGNLPTHPELLDYLAVRFRQSNWNVKALLQHIVLSATYRQSSQTPAHLRETDPDNTFLARGPSYRLSAEQIRDNVLKASGLLVEKVGGPSVYPYQPSGVWESLSTLHYPQNHGDSLYRRSMYTFWKRTAPHPAMLTFDAPEKHLCTVRRQKTSTPLQSLVTLNDPQFVEAARILAQRLLREGGPTTQSRIQFAAKAVINRPARTSELQLLQELYKVEHQNFTKFPKQASQLLTVGEKRVLTTSPRSELAAWTVVALTLFNYDEAVMKR
ncbi:MAG: DUF1553 domain-containing protein [Cytophagaceae bacterium]|nr:DUF1553 domain-containing protein [Cytophagaceae bacterium]